MRDEVPSHRSFISPGKFVLLCLGLLTGVLCLYSRALHGHFIFDDLTLPYANSAGYGPLSTWLSVTGVRPVLMFSYWLNYVLVLLVLHRLLEKAGWPSQKAKLASIIGALVFAIHPLQTESVSYVAGRSESLAALFLPLAYAAFLYRRHESISWTEAWLVLLLFAAALLTKENAVSLAAILVLTDLFWPAPFSLRGLKRNWRLYCLMVPGAIAAAIAVFRMLAAATSAGFSVATFKWYQYAFTEARALFTYVRLSVLPLGQSLDHDDATSHTVTEHGAIYYMLLLAVIVSATIVLRRRYPLFCFGFLMFLIWLAPTSSIVPLDDALVERRTYVPLLGLILMGCEACLRLRPAPPWSACWRSFSASFVMTGIACGASRISWSNWRPPARCTIPGLCSISPRSCCSGIAAIWRPRIFSVPSAGCRTTTMWT